MSSTLWPEYLNTISNPDPHLPSLLFRLDMRMGMLQAKWKNVLAFLACTIYISNVTSCRAPPIERWHDRQSVTTRQNVVALASSTDAQRMNCSSSHPATRWPTNTTKCHTRISCTSIHLTYSENKLKTRCVASKHTLGQPNRRSALPYRDGGCQCSPLIGGIV